MKTSLVGFLAVISDFWVIIIRLLGEGQIKASIPLFMQPLCRVTRLGTNWGYAKENEANFAGYLACKESPSVDFRYSVYYDMYSYAISDLYRADLKMAIGIDTSLHRTSKKRPA